MTQQAYSAIVDLQRRLKSDRSKIRRIMDRAQQHDVSCIDDHDRPIEDDQPLAEWLKDAKDMAKAQFRGGKYRNGRKFYNISQLIAIAALMKRYNLTCRKTEILLKSRDDLCEALGFRRISTQLGYRVPGFMMIHRAQKALAQYMVEQGLTGENRIDLN